MIKHFGIYTNSGDVQTDLNEETLINPYVAKVSDSLDYNSIQPVEPCYLSEWWSDEEVPYEFDAYDKHDAAWANGVQIGTLLNVYFNGGEEPIDMPIILSYLGDDEWGDAIWHMEIQAEGESNPPTHDFDTVYGIDWDVDGVMTDPSSSTGQVKVTWAYDLTGGFRFYKSEDDAPDLSIDTINPECETEPTPEPEPTCEEQGLCEDAEGNCYPCDEPTCQDACDGDPECECTCQGPDWYWNPDTQTCEQYGDADPCGGDPECECNQLGPDWGWNGEECIYTDPDESGPDVSE